MSTLPSTFKQINYTGTGMERKLALQCRQKYLASSGQPAEFANITNVELTLTATAERCAIKYLYSQLFNCVNVYQHSQLGYEGYTLVYCLCSLCTHRYAANHTANHGGIYGAAQRGEID